MLIEQIERLDPALVVIDMEDRTVNAELAARLVRRMRDVKTTRILGVAPSSEYVARGSVPLDGLHAGPESLLDHALEMLAGR
ncbi:MAG: hypothetical protein ABI678_01205 [Kofleriaceae bacterium]